MLHGAGIFTYIYTQNGPVLQVNIPYMEHIYLYNLYMVPCPWFPPHPHAQSFQKSLIKVATLIKWSGGLPKIMVLEALIKSSGILARSLN